MQQGISGIKEYSFECSDPMPLEFLDSDTVGCPQSHSHSAAKIIFPVIFPRYINPISSSPQLIIFVSVSPSLPSPFLVCYYCAMLIL